MSGYFSNNLEDHPVLKQVRAAKLKEAQSRPCFPKVRYATASDAADALDAMHAKGRDEQGTKRLNRYHCRFCDGFHLGNTTKPSAVPLQGNAGTVSFEETSVGEHTPEPQSRRKRRAKLSAPLPRIVKGRRPAE